MNNLFFNVLRLIFLKIRKSFFGRLGIIFGNVVIQLVFKIFLLFYFGLIKDNKLFKSIFTFQKSLFGDIFIKEERQQYDPVEPLLQNSRLFRPIGELKHLDERSNLFIVLIDEEQRKRAQRFTKFSSRRKQFKLKYSFFLDPNLIKEDKYISKLFKKDLITDNFLVFFSFFYLCITSVYIKKSFYRFLILKLLLFFKIFNRIWFQELREFFLFCFKVFILFCKIGVKFTRKCFDILFYIFRLFVVLIFFTFHYFFSYLFFNLLVFFQKKPASFYTLDVLFSASKLKIKRFWFYNFFEIINRLKRELLYTLKIFFVYSRVSFNDSYTFLSERTLKKFFFLDSSFFVEVWRDKTFIFRDFFGWYKTPVFKIALVLNKLIKLILFFIFLIMFFFNWCDSIFYLIPNIFVFFLLLLIFFFFERLIVWGYFFLRYFFLVKNVLYKITINDFFLYLQKIYKKIYSLYTYHLRPLLLFIDINFLTLYYYIFNFKFAVLRFYTILYRSPNTFSNYFLKNLLIFLLQEFIKIVIICDMIFFIKKFNYQFVKSIKNFVGTFRKEKEVDFGLFVQNFVYHKKKKFGFFYACFIIIVYIFFNLLNLFLSFFLFPILILSKIFFESLKLFIKFKLYLFENIRIIGFLQIFGIIYTIIFENHDLIRQIRKKGIEFIYSRFLVSNTVIYRNWINFIVQLFYIYYPLDKRNFRLWTERVKKRSHSKIFRKYKNKKRYGFYDIVKSSPVIVFFFCSSFNDLFFKDLVIKKEKFRLLQIGRKNLSLKLAEWLKNYQKNLQIISRYKWLDFSFLRYRNNLPHTESSKLEFYVRIYYIEKFFMNKLVRFKNIFFFCYVAIFLMFCVLFDLIFMIPVEYLDWPHFFYILVNCPGFLIINLLISCVLCFHIELETLLNFPARKKFKYFFVGTLLFVFKPSSINFFTYFYLKIKPFFFRSYLDKKYLMLCESEFLFTKLVWEEEKLIGGKKQLFYDNFRLLGYLSVFYYLYNELFLYLKKTILEALEIFHLTLYVNMPINFLLLNIFFFMLSISIIFCSFYFIRNFCFLLIYCYFKKNREIYKNWFILKPSLLSLLFVNLGYKEIPGILSSRNTFYYPKMNLTNFKEELTIFKISEYLKEMK